MDLRYDETKVDAAWNFINKIWNASRYVLMQLEPETEYAIDPASLSASDQWIMDRFNRVLAEVEKNMDSFEFGIAGNAVQDFVWNDFCSWYIELSKTDKSRNTSAVLLEVLKNPCSC